jgi:hypothetical protein
MGKSDKSGAIIRVQAGSNKQRLVGTLVIELYSSPVLPVLYCSLTNEYVG